MSVFGEPSATSDAVRLAALEATVAELEATIAATAATAAGAVSAESGNRVTGDQAADTARQQQQAARIAGDQSLADMIVDVDTRRGLDREEVDGELARLGLIATERAGFDYIANGSADTEGLRAVFAAVVATGKPALVNIRGPVIAIATPDANPAFDLTGLPPGTIIDFNGGTVRHGWDVANPETTLGSWIVGTNLIEPQILNFVYELSPRPTWEGYVASIDNPDVFITMKPGFAPAFVDMDNFGEFLPNGRSGGVQYEGSGSGSGSAYPIVQVSGNTYKMTPPERVAAVTGVLSYNPLTLIVPLHGLTVGRTVVVSGVIGLAVDGVSIVNDLEFVVDDDENPNRLILLNGDDTIDASAASAYVSGGLITAPRFPTWLAVGKEVWGMARKRVNPVIDPTTIVRPRIVGRFKSAVSVAVRGLFWEDPYLDVTFRGDGKIGANAGGVVPTEVRGTITGRISGVGMGDDLFNPVSLLWKAWITAVGANSITVRSNKVSVPRVGDTLRFENGATKTDAQISAVATAGILSTVTVQLPVGYDPATWRTRNLATAAAVRLDSLDQKGGGRTLIAQSSDWQVGIFNVRNLRSTPIRHQYPSSTVHPNTGGADGGGFLPAVTAVNSAFVYSASAAVLHHRVIGATGAENVPPVRYGNVLIDGYGFCAVNADAIDVSCDSLTLRNGGLARSTTRQTMTGQDVLANYDLSANFRTLTINRLNRDALDWVKVCRRNGGNIVIGNSASDLLIHAADAAVTVNTIRYGSVRITAALTAPRNVVLTRGVLQRGDTLEVVYEAAGGQAVVKDEAGTTLATLVGADRAVLRFDGTQLRLSSVAPIAVKPRTRFGGSTAIGQTQIEMARAVAAGGEASVSLTIGGVPYDPGIHFTCNGSLMLTLAAPETAVLPYFGVNS